MSKSLLVVGGSRGIGAATALCAAEAGYDVAISFRQDTVAAEDILKRVRALGRRALAIQADISVAGDVVRLYQNIDNEFGKIDAVVNSAGISLRSTLVEDTAPEALERLFKTNVLGLILSSKEAVKRLSRRHGGRGGVIINVSSMAATIGGRPGSSLYAASKAAVDAFTTGLAKEVGRDGIRAISARPGFTRTDMTKDWQEDEEAFAKIAATIPFGRPAEADEIAKPIVWLLSDQASFISGAHLDISGGGFLVGGGYSQDLEVPLTI